MTAEVVVVGAGPIGLATAALLHAAGIDVRIVDRGSEPSRYSKATTVHPRTLEVLQAVRAPGGSVADLMVAAGRKLPATHFGLLPQLLDYRGLDTEFPYVLMIPQAVTEGILAGHLAAQGIAVRRGAELCRLEQDADRVRLHLRSAGREETVVSRFVVGADGARSTVRRELGVGFPGTEPTLCGFVGDVELRRPPGEPHFWDAARGTLNVLPLPGGRYRVFGVEAADTGLTPAQVRARRDVPVDRAGLRASMTRIAGTDYGLGTVFWGSRNTDTTRHAERVRAGRVFLAGDAAHIHLPAGGQGLNVGVQDAANLAWKLAAEVRGWAPAHLRSGTASYEAERLPVARRLAANTLAQSAVAMTFSPANAELRRMLGEFIAHQGDTAAELTGWLSGLDVHYPAGPPPEGRRLPPLPLARGSLHDALRVHRFLLVGFGGRDVGDAALAGIDRTLVEPATTPGQWCGLAFGLVRPDGHLARGWPAECSTADIAAGVAHWTTATTQCRSAPPGNRDGSPGVLEA
ncbi:FAD-dependent monooxygenase [Amycolatopsis sp., V23-08]|uniref:FAD-dependent monooxygenase n=1 Tax=Amycolatopsis heterodermiae TaxID=3110235 RepID=A0ABU5RA46_9PSEU|nr:FAD-dependent monooxygenase [Amycolatopsis sp., V23-08]MEA5362500.1 FAD-dependent monooxygenase [Amycolatopsis sp., V23-08]